MEWLIYIALIAFFVLIAMAFTGGEDQMKVVERIQKVQAAGPGGPKGPMFRDQEMMQKSLGARLLLPLGEKLAKLLGNSAPGALVEEHRKLIAGAGLTGKVTAQQVTALAFFFLAAVPFGMVSFFALADAKALMDPTNLMMIMVGGALGFKGPSIIIQSQANKRRAQIQKALPFSFDLISIGVEAGVSFDQALALVAEKTSGPFTDEINITLNEVRLGKSRVDALRDFGERVGLEDLRSFLTAVSYIAKMGGSMVDVIRVQSDALRTKRRQRAEEKAMKTPVKIMFPLVFFIFPCMFIVILGPVIVDMIGGKGL